MAFDIENALVFGLHGIDDGGPNWSDRLFKVLDEAIAAFGYSAFARELRAQQKHSVRELIDFHEINYGTVFQNVLTNWAKNAADVIESAQGLPQQREFERCMGLLEAHCDPNDRVVWPHLAGVFFWKTSSYVRAMIKNEVAAVLSAQVAARRQQDRGKRIETSLLAHGLGTAVAMETLNDMYRGGWNGARWTTQDMHFDSYHAIANVCGLLGAEPADAYDGFVRPAAAGESAVLCYYDYRHRADPFTCVRSFVPTGWPQDLYESVVVQHVRGTNVHALDHYVQHPAVHIPILRSWFGYCCIGEQEEQAARNTFPDVSLDHARAEVVDRIARLAQRELLRSSDAAELLQGIAAFRALLHGSDA